MSAGPPPGDHQTADVFMPLSPTASFDPPSPQDRPVPPSSSFAIHAGNDAGREEIEEFIRRVYASRYGARIPQFAPVLVSLRDPSGELVAAAGYRAAATAPLFLERYLDGPIEQVLGRHLDVPAPRKDIVEVGHLAGTRAGEGRRLIHYLGAHLAAHGYQWVVGTLTRELRHLFLRIGIEPLELGRADPRSLGEQAMLWGSYYDHGPAVLAGHIPQAMNDLARRRGHKERT